MRGGILGTIGDNILSAEDREMPFAKYIKDPSLMIAETKLPPMFLVTSAEDIIRNDTLTAYRIEAHSLASAV